MNLTPRQLDVLVAIRNYRHLHGMAPTMQELADQLGTSKVTIFEHIEALERKGVIRRNPHMLRSLEIVAKYLPDEERPTKLPLLVRSRPGLRSWRWRIARSWIWSRSSRAGMASMS